MKQGLLQRNPMMGLFNQMMGGKNRQQQIQTLLNSAQSKGIDINERRFTKQDLMALGLNPDNSPRG